MNNPVNGAWPGQEQLGHMPQVSEQEFSNFLDLSNIDLDFPLYGAHGGDSTENNGQQYGQLPDSLEFQDAPEGGLVDQHQHVASGKRAATEANEAFFDFGMPHFGIPQDAQQAFGIPTSGGSNFHAHQAVPPTPNSIELQGNPVHFLSQLDAQSRAILEQRYQLRKEDAIAFTPLVSPAVTPHDARFQMPQDTAVPGSYFSPLVSPALEAQNQNQNNKRTFAHSQFTSVGSSDPSPVDIDMDILGDPALTQSETVRKPKTKTYPRSVTSTPRFRQSPGIQPRRRKPTLTSSLPPKEVSDLLEEVQKSKAATQQSIVSPANSHSYDTSEGESISPEPLSEAMGPPPRPGSLTQSPSILAQAGTTVTNNQGMCPATPASIMRLHESPVVSGTRHSPLAPPPNTAHTASFTSALEEFILPEAAASAQTPGSAYNGVEDQSTPRLPARKTPRLGPLSTPSGAAALSGKASPMLSAVNSPTSPRVIGRKPDPKGSRAGKKRNSISSTLVSPALRPKISPSIKPMLPEGALTDETHALLLASKSNYQNILEGTNIPGLNYPEALSTNLTSKRTSHKIAEQGRRNRINTALAEMQTLLPQSAVTSDKESSALKSPSIAAQQNNSKAATVESAIDFIRLLKAQADEQDRKIEERDRELELLRIRLKELDGDKTSHVLALSPSPHVRAGIEASGSVIIEGNEST